MATYNYVNAQGQTQQVQANSVQEALANAPGIASNSGVQLVTPPPIGAPQINPVMSTDVLSQNGTQPALPSLTPTSSPNAFVAGISAGMGQPVASSAPNVQPLTVPTSNSELLNKLATSYNQLAGKGAEQLRLEGQAGISDQEKAIADLQQDILETTARYNAAQENFRSGQVGTQELSTGKIAQVQRNEAVVLGLKNAQLMGLQGRLDSAKAEIARTLDLEFDPIYTQIEALKTFASLNPDLTASQTKTLNSAISGGQSSADALYQAKQDAYNLVLDTYHSVANPSFYDAINAATTVEEVQQAVATIPGAENIGVETNFTTTQTNKGAANAGMTVSSFKMLPSDVQNFFVNTPVASIKSMTDAVNNAVSSSDIQTVTDQINSSNLSDPVKQYFLSQLPPAESSTGGFWDWLTGIFK